MSINGNRARGHDQSTANPDQDPGAIPTVNGADQFRPDSGASAPLLETALEQLRLDGAIFFRSELSEPFSFESTPNVVAGVLHPGAERIILFHIVARGSCWVSDPGGERHAAAQGDVIVAPYGDPHVIGG